MILRLRFAKRGRIRFLGHRDVARVWERAIRRAGLPLAWTEGFTPRPRVSFGLALPTGYESDGEYLDLAMRADGVEGDELLTQGVAAGGHLPVSEVPERLSDLLPEGMWVQAAALRGPDERRSLQESVTTCTWWLEVLDADEARVEALCDQIRSSPTLPFARERKGKVTVEDLQASISGLGGVGAGALGAGVMVELAAQPRVVRPSNLLAALDPDLEEGRTRRVHQWMERDGRRVEPLELPADLAGAGAPALTGPAAREEERDE